jgi:hypothetical protein
VLCQHPINRQLNEYVRADWGYKQLNDWIVSQGYPKHHDETWKRHREGHLKLAPLPSGRPTRLPFALVPQDAPLDAPVPDTKELKDEALRVWFWRLKHAPEQVPTAELTRIVAKVLDLELKTRGGGSDEDEIIKQLSEEGLDGERSSGPVLEASSSEGFGAGEDVQPGVGSQPPTD